MKQLNGYKMRVVFVGIVAVNVLGGGIARGDFTFGEPVNLGPNVNSAMNDGGLTISSDGLSLFFESNRSGNNWDIWQCTRETIEDEWGPAKNLGPTVNSPQAEGRPSISADGLELFFCSLYWMAVRPGGFGGADLWVTRRTSVSHPWSTPENLGSLVNSAWHESEPYISADGLELYFSSDRPGGEGYFDLYFATRPTKNDAWDAPVNLGPVVNGSGYEAQPCISADGLALFFASSRRPDGYGNYDIYITTRSTTSDPWGEPVNLGPIINNAASQFAHYISPDGSTLYLDAGGSLFGKADLWQVQIIPIVDLNGDGIVDSVDMCIIVDNWGTSETLCDIGPMPWGDGIVDVQDLIVLAEHLFEEVVPPTPTPPTSFGSFIEDPPGTYTMTDRGADIWGVDDQFHFAYKTLTGPGSIVAKIESLTMTNTDPWAKAGVMIRETLEPGSKFAAVYITPGNGCRFQARVDTDAGGTSDTPVATDEQKAIVAPYWIKLERDVADNFRGYYSSDGVTWRQMSWNPRKIPMNTDVHVGLALTSHNILETCQAVFSNVTITGDVAPQWANQDVGPSVQP